MAMNANIPIRTFILGPSSRVLSEHTPYRLFQEHFFYDSIFDLLFVTACMFFLALLLIFFTRKQRFSDNTLTYASAILIIISVVALRIISQITYNTPYDSKETIHIVRKAVKDILIDFRRRFLERNDTSSENSKSTLTDQNILSISRAKATVLGLLGGKLYKRKSSALEPSIPASNAAVIDEEAIDETEEPEEESDETVETPKVKIRQTVPDIVQKKIEIAKSVKKDESTYNFYCESDEILPYIKCIKDSLKRIEAADYRPQEMLKGIEEKAKTGEKDAEMFIEKFREFHRKAMKIERKMALVNASPEYMMNEAERMVSNIRDVYKITRLTTLFKRRDALATEVAGKSSKRSGGGPGSWSESLHRGHFLEFLQLFLISEALLGFCCIFCILCAPGYPVWVCRILILASLVLSFFISVYLMFGAHIAERFCAVGGLEGCEYASGSLSNNGGSLPYSHLQVAMKRMGEETKCITDMIRSYFVEGKELSAIVHLQVIQEFFKKIFFARTELSEISVQAIDKHDLLMDTGMLYRVIERMRESLKSFKRKELLEIYTREISFLEFARREVNRIPQMAKKLEKAEKEGKLQNDKCLSIMEYVCRASKALNQAFILLLVSSIILSLCFTL